MEAVCRDKQIEKRLQSNIIVKHTHSQYTSVPPTRKDEKIAHAIQSGFILVSLAQHPYKDTYLSA